MDKKIKALIITGPTATGKTALAVRLARRFAGEIISADSRQVYRGLDIGTGKDLSEYSFGGEPVPFHLIDIVPPDEDYNLLRFCQDASAAVAKISAAGHLPIIAGGTPLYLHALISGYTMPGPAPDPAFRETLREKAPEELSAMLRSLSPVAYEKLARNGQMLNRTRLVRAVEKVHNPVSEERFHPLENVEFLVLGSFFPRSDVRSRIRARLEARLASGMLDEVATLHEQGLSWERLEYFGLEYRWLARHLQGKINYEEMLEGLYIKICDFAKSQDVWFRKMEREGVIIHWLSPVNETSCFETLSADFLEGRPLAPPARRMSDIRYGPVSN